LGVTSCRGSSLLAAGVFGHSFGALAHGVLGELTGQKETYSCLDLPGSQSRPPVVVGQSRGLGGDALEDVVHERVHDGHGLAANASVGVHLLQDLVDVDGVRLPPPLPALLVSSALGLCLRGGLLRSLTRGCLRRHGDVSTSTLQHKLIAAQRCAAIYTRERAVCVALARRRRKVGAGGGNLPKWFLFFLWLVFVFLRAVFGLSSQKHRPTAYLPVPVSTFAIFH